MRSLRARHLPVVALALLLPALVRAQPAPREDRPAARRPSVLVPPPPPPPGVPPRRRAEAPARPPGPAPRAEGRAPAARPPAAAALPSRAGPASPRPSGARPAAPRPPGGAEAGEAERASRAREAREAREARRAARALAGEARDGPAASGQAPSPGRPAPTDVPGRPVGGLVPVVPSVGGAAGTTPRAPAAPRLAGPFRPVPPASGDASPCEEPPRPVRNLEGFGYYLDPAFSRPDPARLAMDTEAARPLAAWLDHLRRALDRHRAGEAGAAACALDALDLWARNEALLGAFNQQGDYHRAWTLSGTALVFLAVREAPGLEPARAARVGRWLAAIARALIPRHDRRSAAIISEVRNNQAAWAGLAAAAAGVAAGDRGLLDWGVARLRGQLAQVDPRGALPQEVARKGRALRYHLFALEAVAATERLAAANGIVLTEAERDALRRLRDLLLAAAGDPARMEAIAGAPQDLPEGGPFADAVGLELATLALPDAAADAALAPFRPLASPRLGGAVTGWWTPAAPEAGPSAPEAGGAEPAPPVTPPAVTPPAVTPPGPGAP